MSWQQYCMNRVWKLRFEETVNCSRLFLTNGLFTRLNSVLEWIQALRSYYLTVRRASGRAVFVVNAVSTPVTAIMLCAVYKNVVMGFYLPETGKICNCTLSCFVVNQVYLVYVLLTCLRLRIPGLDIAGVVTSSSRNVSHNRLETL